MATRTTAPYLRYGSVGGGGDGLRTGRTSSVLRGEEQTRWTARTSDNAGPGNVSRPPVPSLNSPPIQDLTRQVRRSFRRSTTVPLTVPLTPNTGRLLFPNYDNISRTYLNPPPPYGPKNRLNVIRRTERFRSASTLLSTHIVPGIPIR